MFKNVYLKRLIMVKMPVPRFLEQILMRHGYVTSMDSVGQDNVASDTSITMNGYVFLVRWFRIRYMAEKGTSNRAYLSFFSLWNSYRNLWACTRLIGIRQRVKNFLTNV